jgi:hypothetical protein
MKRIIPALILATAIILNGCVAKRGVDFGHWALIAERRELVKMQVADHATLSRKSTLCVLPVLGSMPADLSLRFRNQLVLNIQDHVTLEIVTPPEDENLSAVLKADNLLKNGTPRLSEISGAGKVFDTSHVLCINATDYSPYPPQKINFEGWLVNSSNSKVEGSFTASLDASEQQTVLAVGEHMQSRRARPYDEANLDIMLQSPSEFIDFASAYTARHLARQMGRHGLPLRQIPAANTPDGVSK